MNVIIEGQDRVGKSTLVAQLREVLFNPVVIHSSAPPKSAPNPYTWEYAYYTSIAGIVTRAGYEPNDFILDRFHFGVSVYGKNYRKYNDLMVSALFEATERILMNSHIQSKLITIVDRSDEIMRRNDGLSLETTSESFETTRKAFISAHEKSSLDKILIDVTENGGFANTLPTVLKFLNQVPVTDFGDILSKYNEQEE